ncbi:beta-ketoacyl synthase N-terminal-like domain-containing protein, partial [Micromonospora sp. WMMD737]|uniref:beta-ketoacyl synthase N-terminal-like domain-containing protein n=1 Tax=Micromonospora sp. WMMD737 TaxID=3404113 RepID=UPI003B946922
MSDFEPVAIVGRSCILPGATSPAELFEATKGGRCLLTPTPRDAWRGVDPGTLHSSRQPGLRVASATGGYIEPTPDMSSAPELAGIASRI